MIFTEKLANESKPFMRINGHRGCMGYPEAPENTLAAFKKALDAGAEAIEFDIHLTKDGHLVIIHDDTLERTTNGTGNVKDKTLAGLHEFDAGNGEKIPTLKEVYDLVGEYIAKGRRVFINNELKGQGTAKPVCDLIAHYAAKPGWSYDNFSISSFEMDMLREVIAYNPQVRVGALWWEGEQPSLKKDPKQEVVTVTEIIEALGGAKPYSINPPAYMIDKAYVDAAHKEGIIIACWGIEGEPETYKGKVPTIKQLAQMGVDEAITNHPGRAVEEITRQLGRYY